MSASTCANERHVTVVSTAARDHLIAQKPMSAVIFSFRIALIGRHASSFSKLADAGFAICTSNRASAHPKWPYTAAAAATKKEALPHLSYCLKTMDYRLSLRHLPQRKHPPTEIPSGITHIRPFIGRDPLCQRRSIPVMWIFAQPVAHRHPLGSRVPILSIMVGQHHLDQF